MLFGEIEIFAGFKESHTEAVCVTSGILADLLKMQLRKMKP